MANNQVTHDYTRELPVSRAGDDYENGTNGTLFGPQANLRATAADLRPRLRA